MDQAQACKICGAATRPLHRGLYDSRHGCPGYFDIARCTACGFCRTVPASTRSDLSELYRKYYPRSTLTPATVMDSFRKKQRRTARELWWRGAGTECQLHVTPGSRVLDVGCGDCTSLLLASARGARDVVGIEVDGNVKHIAEALSLDLHLGQLGALPAEKGKFDFILGRQMLEHEPEPLAMLLEMKRRLASGGRIVLSFPNVDAFSRRFYRERWLHWHVPFHINHFSRRSVVALAGQSAMRIEMLRTVTPNEWSRYQRRFAKVRIAPGQRDSYWDPPPQPVSSTPDPAEAGPPGRSARAEARRVDDLRDFAVGALNRFVDSLGLGDSWVLVLTVR
jgi:SAM-dependent methyltransferase